MKAKTHVVAIRVTFDKPVSKAAAVRAIKSSVGEREFYACIGEQEQDGWGKMKTRSCFSVAGT